MKVVRTLAHTYIHIHKKCIEIVDGEVLSTQHHLYVQIAFILNPSFERGSASSSSTIGGIIHQLVYTHLPFGRGPIQHSVADDTALSYTMTISYAVCLLFFFFGFHAEK